MLNEDRPEFERILDGALRTAPDRPDLAAMGERINSEQLRTMALNATALITAAAATEYEHYVKVREELRERGSAAPSIRERSSEDRAKTSGGLPPATTMGEAAAQASGAGVGAVVAVLAPLLIGTGAAIFLLVGYILKMIDPEPAFADTLLTVGWLLGVLAAVGTLVAGVGLILTAMRSGSTSLEAGAYGENEEVVRAREAWGKALLERGLLPFLREALADPEVRQVARTRPTGPSSRMPHLGYHRPEFSSPDVGGATEATPSAGSERDPN